ncbi:MAG TPA: DUF262 domain-containing protein [Thermodesulfobacteriota bacterium]|nr:DUF262 domain-containing protein [Thermodesulfobacteriota bacterium]
MSSLDKINIELKGIGNQLSVNTLAVPKYQRSYAWEKNHVEALFKDIATAIRNNEPEYFLGSIVITQQLGRPEVVDGQQRLATITILLSAIRDYFYEIGDKKGAGLIENKYLVSTDLRSREDKPKLSLSETDNDFFRKRILSLPDSPDREIGSKKESHERLVKAAELAKDHVKHIVNLTSKPTEYLHDWIDFLTESVRVIWVTVPDYANAFIIFETLNDRGLELSKSDLIKNYLFLLCAEDRLDEVQQRWVSMVGTIEAIASEREVVSYIRYLWSSLHGVAREKELYDVIKNGIRTKQDAINFADDLERNSRLYAAIMNSDHEFWTRFGSTAKAHIGTLNLLGMVQIKPLLLAILEHFDQKQVKQTLKLLVSWVVRFQISGTLSSGIFETQFSQRAVEVRRGKIKTARYLISKMKDVVPSDTQFKDAFSTATITKTKIARYILHVLEGRHGKKRALSL